jgi:hypothetical protein
MKILYNYPKINFEYLRFIDSSLISDKNYLKDIFIKAINDDEINCISVSNTIDTIDNIIQEKELLSSY